jgi:hypothetical protein
MRRAAGVTLDPNKRAIHFDHLGPSVFESEMLRSRTPLERMDRCRPSEVVQPPGLYEPRSHPHRAEPCMQPTLNCQRPPKKSGVRSLSPLISPRNTKGLQELRLLTNPSMRIENRVDMACRIETRSEYEP